MRRRIRFVGMAAIGALGMAAALAIGAGADGSARQTALTLRGEDFKRGKNGTITINGVPFRRTRGNTITINGLPFRRSGQTLTINGNSFRTGTLPNSLTINGTSFRSSGNTLTINGTEFGPGVASTQGPPGPQGPEGKAGPAGTLPPGKAPVSVVGPVSVANGETKLLTSITFTGSEPRRLLLTGGFNLVCNPCTDRITPGWTITQEGSGSSLVQRRTSPLSDGEFAGGTVSEIVVTPDVCGPCTYNLNLVVPSGVSGQASNVDATAIRLGLADLGPVN